MRFDSYHPTINLIYFVAAFAMVIAFRHPAYLLIPYVAVFLYSISCAESGRLCSILR